MAWRGGEDGGIATSSDEDEAEEAQVKLTDAMWAWFCVHAARRGGEMCGEGCRMVKPGRWSACTPPLGAQVDVVLCV